jgi:hypothetical protein
MTRVAASGLATAFALAALGGTMVAALQAQAQTQTFTSAQTMARGVDDSVDLGQCLLEYDTLPAHRQPAAMECEHANWIARTWGGRVMEMTHEGLVERASHAGRNDFTGVPAEALPGRGYCRAWLDGVAASRQPAEGDCRSAARLARERGGRVIFMPL